MPGDDEPHGGDSGLPPGDQSGEPTSSEELIRRAREGVDSTAGNDAGVTGARRAPRGEPAPTADRPGPPPDPFGRPAPPGSPPLEAPPSPAGTDRRNSVMGLLIAAVVVAVLTVGVVSIFRAGRGEEPPPNAAVEATREALEDVGVRESSIDCVIESLQSEDAFSTLDGVNSKALGDLGAGGVGMPPEIVPFMAAFVETLPDCLSATELQAFATAPATEGPRTLGDNAELDGLWRSCEAGDYEACDLLFIVSPVGSDYEAFGGGCGDREAEVSLPCIVVLGVGPDLVGWEQRCGEGDFGACDLLFSLSAVGSDEERFGATCGNRNEASDVLPLPCTMRYGLGTRP